MPSPSSLSSTKSLLHFFFLILLLVGSALARSRHVITFGSPGLAPAGLAWDPVAQHFLVGSRLRPSVSSVSDAGVVETLISDPLLPTESSALALAVDNPRRRLLVVFRPATLAAYDLRSPRPHRRIFSSTLPDPAAVPGGVAVDSSTGDAFVTSATGNLIWKVDLDGNPSVFSKSPIYSPPESPGDEHRPEATTAERGLGGVAHESRGFLLAVQGSTGRVFKVDTEGGAARTVMDAGAKKGLAAEAQGVAMRSDGGAVVAGGRKTRWLTSQDGWAAAAVYDEVALEKGLARAVAMRGGSRVYLLVTPEEEEEDEGNLVKGDDGEYKGKRNRIEEVEWGRDSEAEMVWVLVLVGFGLAYFLYWRFQMRQLVSNMNKKRA